MLGRIALVTVVVGCLLVAVSKGSLLERVGLLGSCQAVAAPPGDEAEASWQACRAGRLEGRPDLRRDSCKRAGIAHGLEYWRCPAPVSAGHRAEG
jgi:hypothetical protein